MNPLFDRLDPEQLELVQRFFGLIDHLAVLQAEAMLALSGVALIALMAAPERHARATARLGAEGIASFVTGAAALLLPALVLAVLYRSGIPAGRFLLWTALALAVGCGLAVTGGRLGERVLPDRGPLAQTAVGAGAVVLLIAFPLLVPVALALAAAGLGAWLRARAPRA